MLETFTFTRDTETGATAVSGNIQVVDAAHRLMDIAIAMEINKTRQEMRNDKLEQTTNKGHTTAKKVSDADTTANDNHTK